MKKVALSALVIILFNIYANAQNLKYSDEGFNTKQIESTYAIRTAGQQFIQRMNVLYNQSEAAAYKRITRDQYSEFLKSFENLISIKKVNGTVSRNLSVLSSILNSVNDFGYNNDEYRNAMYHIAVPVYKAVIEDWGDEIINIAIYNAYFDMHEYVEQKSVDDSAMKMTLQLMEDNPINTNTNETCNYTVTVDPAIIRDNVEIYFTDPALYNMASKKYPADQLLTGPIISWENNVDESASVHGMLKSYAMQPKHSAYTIYSYDILPNRKNNTLNQPLYKGNKWFMWVFRNGKLYYTYMAEPCSSVNKAVIK